MLTLNILTQQHFVKYILGRGWGVVRKREKKAGCGGPVAPVGHSDGGGEHFRLPAALGAHCAPGATWASN